MDLLISACSEATTLNKFFYFLRIFLFLHIYLSLKKKKQRME